MIAEARKRVEKLRKEIQYHRSNYHINDKSTISGGVLDSLMHELSKLETEYPELITPDSPTQRVGGEVLSQFEKITHQVPMISLNDVFDEEELYQWEHRNKGIISHNDNWQYFVELKLDGLAVSLTYKNLEFVQGLTRGNGREGENISHNIRTIQDIPLDLSITEDNIQQLKSHNADLAERFQSKWQGGCEVRGEVYMRDSQLQKLNRELKTKGQSGN